MGKLFVFSSFLVGALAWQGGLASSHAQVINLTDGNSAVQLNPNSSSGMSSWQVQGQQELAQQWFWFRVGATGGEAPINTIGTPTVTANNGTRGLTTVYNASQFSLRVDYTLSGGSVVAAGQTGVSGMTENITINNTSTSTLDFHFFQYSDFDLGGSGNDTIRLGTDLDGLYDQAKQTDGLAGVTENTLATGANHGEAGLFPATLNKLNDLSPTTLSDTVGPTTGDGTWALEWDLSIAPGTSASILKALNLNVTIVPEPSTWALAAVGAGLLLAFKRRRATA